MPPKRKPAAQAAHRRNPEPEDANMRTRSGGRGKPNAGKTDHNNTPSSPNHNGSSPILTRKMARSTSDRVSPFRYFGLSTRDMGAYATYDRPILTIRNMDPDFLAKLKKTEKSTRPKKVILSYSTAFGSTTPESEAVSDSPPAPQPAPARRGRGGRGGRARGRGRGRGGAAAAARKEAFPDKPVQVSPRKNRPVRNAAPAFPLTEVDEESPSNQDSPYESAKETVHHQPSPLLENITVDVQNVDDEAEAEHMQGVESTNATPKISPPRGLQTPDSATPAVAAPSQASESQEQNAPTPKEDSNPTPAEPVQIVNPEDDLLMDDDLLPPFLTNIKKPTREECEDEADYLLRTRYEPLNDATAIVDLLSKYPAAARSTEVLYKLALHAQETLEAWQDQYLALDQKTAPHQHPPKKPAHGGRVPINPPMYEDMKEADLYGYVYDGRKQPGGQDPFAQRLGRDNVGGRELRQRRNRELASAAVTEDEDEENLGRGNRRKRRAVQRFDATTEPNTGANTPRPNGWGGARKRGVSAMAPAGSETPEPDARAKRAKTAANALLPQRVQEMREESMVISSGDEAGSNASKRRGRPPGSKNLQKRSDAGIKKGPRKGTITAAQTPKPAPVTLESLSQGQNQFSIEPRLAAPPLQPLHPNSSSTVAPPMAAPVATVFQAAPQPVSVPSPGLPPTSALHPQTPENLFTTTPLSQYSAMPPEEPSSAVPGADKKRKQRVKSEKRSISMTIWWAERKARAAEQKAAQQHVFQPPETQFQKRTLAGGSPRTSPPPSSPRSLGTSRAPSRAPQPTLLPLNTGLAALPSNPPMNPSPRPGMPILAPAPAPLPPPPHMTPQFASPYPPPPPPPPPGQRPVIPRPKSGGPPPLAPAPPSTGRREATGHISPYPPVGPGMGIGPVGGLGYKHGGEGR